MLKQPRPRFKTGSQHTQKVSTIANLGLDMLKPSRPRLKTGSQHTQKVSKVANLGLASKSLDLSLGQCQLTFPYFLFFILTIKI